MDFAENKATLHQELMKILAGKFDQKGTPIQGVFKHEKHLNYVLQYLTKFRLGANYDIQKPWLVYWGLNSLAALDELEELTREDRLVLGEFLLSFQDENGGFAGGQGYLPNIVSVYATLLSLAILDLPEINERVNVKGIENFMLSCRGPIPGSYYIHENGEIDIRCSYIVALACKMLNIQNPELTAHIPEFIKSCQTFEGGIAPYPFMEAHGGYTFCGVAAMALLGKLEELDLKRLVFWVSNCQTEYGGFCGRTNKLVDSCYSFWQTASFHMIAEYFESYPEKTNNSITSLLYDPERLQVYELECCQEEDGGLKDKPGKFCDIYHTAYGLSGLALASEGLEHGEARIYDWTGYYLADMDPIYNIPRIKVNKFAMCFRDQMFVDTPSPTKSEKVANFEQNEA